MVRFERFRAACGQGRIHPLSRSIVLDLSLLPRNISQCRREPIQAWICLVYWRRAGTTCGGRPYEHRHLKSSPAIVCRRMRAPAERAFPVASQPQLTANSERERPRRREGERGRKRLAQPCPTLGRDTKAAAASACRSDAPQDTAAGSELLPPDRTFQGYLSRLGENPDRRRLLP